jgi:DNA processing protein
MNLSMETGELKYWVAFSRISGVGRARFNLMEGRFGSLAEAWRASASDLQAAGLDGKTAQAIVARRPGIDPDAEMRRLEDAGVSAFTWHDAEYPPRLKEIYDLPPVLYVRGELLPQDERSVAVVGTRKPSAYGREAAYRMTYDLARASVTIVSGLARGIDAIAHRAALEAGQRTIAVVASGVDIVYPAEHASLAAQIVQHGALVSEHPLGVRPDAGNFPRRNRIMSGMTLGTLVVEAGQSSGALITAHHALEQNREVFAVPGRIFSPESLGANRLIRDSAAKLVIDHNDVLEELNLSSVGQQIEMAALFPQDDNEAQVLRYVTFDPIHIDEVMRNSGLPISTVSSTLAMMEIKGLVKQVGGMNYIRLMETPAGYAEKRD